MREILWALMLASMDWVPEVSAWRLSSIGRVLAVGAWGEVSRMLEGSSGRPVIDVGGLSSRPDCGNLPSGYASDAYARREGLDDLEKALRPTAVVSDWRVQ